MKIQPTLLQTQQNRECSCPRYHLREDSSCNKYHRNVTKVCLGHGHFFIFWSPLGGTFSLKLVIFHKKKKSALFQWILAQSNCKQNLHIQQTERLFWGGAMGGFSSRLGRIKPEISKIFNINLFLILKKGLGSLEKNRLIWVFIFFSKLFIDALIDHIVFFSRGGGPRILKCQL